MRKLAGWLVALLLLTQSLIACTSKDDAEPDGVLVASATFTSAGGSVSAEGVSLTVPPGLLTDTATGTIRRLDNGDYDIHIDTEWSGQVQVQMPLAADGDAVVHYRKDGLAIEGEYVGQAQVTVSELSVFSSLSGKLKAAVCLKEILPNKIIGCLALKGLKWIDKKLLGSLLGPLADDPCYSQILSSPGPTALLEAVIGDCVGSAGEGDWTPPPAQPAPPAPETTSEAPPPAAPPAPAAPAPQAPAPVQPPIVATPTTEAPPSVQQSVPAPPATEAPVSSGYPVSLVSFSCVRNPAGADGVYVQYDLAGVDGSTATVTVTIDGRSHTDTWTWPVPGQFNDQVHGSYGVLSPATMSTPTECQLSATTSGGPIYFSRYSN